MSTLSILREIERLWEMSLGCKVELFHDESKNLWFMRIPKDDDYRTPIERATDAAWERNRT